MAQFEVVPRSDAIRPKVIQPSDFEGYFAHLSNSVISGFQPTSVDSEDNTSFSRLHSETRGVPAEWIGFALATAVQKLTNNYRVYFMGERTTTARTLQIQWYDTASFTDFTLTFVGQSGDIPASIVPSGRIYTPSMTIGASSTHVIFFTGVSNALQRLDTTDGSISTLSTLPFQFGANVRVTPIPRSSMTRYGERIALFVATESIALGSVNTDTIYTTNILGGNRQILCELPFTDVQGVTWNPIHEVFYVTRTANSTVFAVGADGVRDEGADLMLDAESLLVDGASSDLALVTDSTTLDVSVDQSFNLFVLAKPDYLDGVVISAYEWDSSLAGTLGVMFDGESRARVNGHIVQTHGEDADMFTHPNTSGEYLYYLLLGRDADDQVQSVELAHIPYTTELVEQYRQNRDALVICKVSVMNNSITVSYADVQYFRGVTPVGTIITSVDTFDAVPEGMLRCDGGTYNVADYPLLARALGMSGATFETPNLTGGRLIYNTGLANIAVKYYIVY